MKSCPTLCYPVDCSQSGSSLHGILQARIVEWVAISFSKGSSRPRDQTWVSHIPGRRFNLWATREAQYDDLATPLLGMWASLVTQRVKHLAGNAGDLGSIPRWGRSPREGNGKPLQYCCLENSTDGGAWWATSPWDNRVAHDWAHTHSISLYAYTIFCLSTLLWLNVWVVSTFWPL